jgi:hypothetical protein
LDSYRTSVEVKLSVKQNGSWGTCKIIDWNEAEIMSVVHYELVNFVKIEEYPIVLWHCTEQSRRSWSCVPSSNAMLLNIDLLVMIFLLKVSNGDMIDMFCVTYKFMIRYAPHWAETYVSIQTTCWICIVVSKRVRV